MSPKTKTQKTVSRETKSSWIISKTIRFGTMPVIMPPLDSITGAIEFFFVLFFKHFTAYTFLLFTLKCPYGGFIFC